MTIRTIGRKPSTRAQPPAAVSRSIKRVFPRNRCAHLPVRPAAALAIVLGLIAAPQPAAAQKNGLGLMLGREIVKSRNGVDIGAGTALYLNYARRVADLKLASVYVEVPFVATTQHPIKSSNIRVPKDLASLFVTPGIKIKLNTLFPITPFIAAGGGYGQFEQSVSQQDAKPNTGPRRTHTVAFDIGGGVEIKLPLPWIRLRAEIRDFISGNPSLNTPLSGKQHNVFAGGGIAIGW